MAVVYLALGSNVGKSVEYINQAIDLLAKSVSDIQQAKMYRSKAVGYTDQADFYNTAVVGTTNLSPQELLVFVKNIEQEVGRKKRFRWGPREIDIDIIFYDDLMLNESNLQVPHTEFQERDFVLQPLCDLNPGFIDPKSNLPINELLAKIPKDQRSIFKQ